MSKASSSPVSFIVDAGRLPAKGVPVSIEADETQRLALAALHDLPSVERFRAELLVKRWRRDGVHVTGRVEASVTQRCVVMLEPLDARIGTEVSALFVPEGSPLARDEGEAGQLVVDPEAEDLPEPFSGGRIDVGAVAEEFFELAIDPFPRHPDAEEPAPPQDSPAGSRQEDRGPMYDALRKLGRKT